MMVDSSMSVSSILWYSLAQRKRVPNEAVEKLTEVPEVANLDVAIREQQIDQHAVVVFGVPGAQPGVIIFFHVEAGFAVMPALHDVQRDSVQMNARAAGMVHVIKITRPSEIKGARLKLFSCNPNLLCPSPSVGKRGQAPVFFYLSRPCRTVSQHSSR